MSHDHEAAHGAHHGPQPAHAHIVPTLIYFKVYLALMFFLILTYGAAQFNFGKFNIVIALAISIVKTSLVVLFFMGVKFNTRLTWLWAALGFVWLLLLFGTMGDYVTREWVRLPQGW